VNEDEKIRVAEANLDRLLDWVSRIDAKSAVVLGGNTAMLGVLATLAPAPHLWTKQTVILGAISTVCPFASLICVYLANYPQTKKPSTSLNFFGGIAKHTLAEYQKAFTELSSRDYLNDLLEQIHRNSEIVIGKFRALKWAYRALLIGVIPWALCLYYFRTFSDSH
jgi:hypothetical protein